MTLSGLLNVNKPQGVTSRRVVDRVERLVKPAKAGHAGTLDPLASGVLVLCIGQATRLIQYVQRMPKRYRATFLLGQESTTEDLEGEITVLENPPRPSAQQIAQAAGAMLGEIEQLPPAYSALKVLGQRAHKLARAGKAVDLQPRKVTIHGIQVLRYDYPELALEIECGSGTYVRSLGRDLARSFGSSALTAALERTAIGPFALVDAVAYDALTEEAVAQHLQPPLTALAGLPRLVLTEEEIAHLAAGRTLQRALPERYSEAAAVDERGRLAAIVAPRGQDLLGPVRNFARDG